MCCCFLSPHWFVCLGYFRSVFFSSFLFFFPFSRFETIKKNTFSPFSNRLNLSSNTVIKGCGITTSECAECTGVCKFLCNFRAFLHINMDTYAERDPVVRRSKDDPEWRALFFLYTILLYAVQLAASFGFFLTDDLWPARLLLLCGSGYTAYLLFLISIYWLLAREHFLYLLMYNLGDILLCPSYIIVAWLYDAGVIEPDKN